MKDRIVFTNPDKSVGVLLPTNKLGLNGIMTNAEYVMNNDVPADATNVRLITTDELPSDRLFRSAWDDSNPENFIGTDLVKAQAIAHGMRRANREDKMKPLDKEGNFFSTTTGRKSAIKTSKQAIMDANATVQSDIDSATDEAGLRSVLLAMAA